MTSLAQLRRIAEVEDVATFPFHFHDGMQATVVAAPFAPTPEQGFRESMAFVQQRI